MKTILFNAITGPLSETFETLHRHAQQGCNRIVAVRQAGGNVWLDLDQGEADSQKPPAAVPHTSPRAFGSPSLRVLCVHGVNHLESEPDAPPTPSEQLWRSAIDSALAHWGASAEVRFFSYNEQFEDADLTPATLAKAVASLTLSGIWHGIGDLFSGKRAFGPQGGLADTLEWTAGMVMEWAGNERLRSALRRALLADIRKHRPQLILAHSLGTLIAYDTLARPAHQSRPGVSGVSLATFGSQIGHPTLRRVFGGRIVPIPAVRHWFHLYNRRDHVFTAPLDVRFRTEQPPNFSQHTVTFDLPHDPLNHNADQYLLHAETQGSLWRFAAAQAGVVDAELPGMPLLASGNRSVPVVRGRVSRATFPAPRQSPQHRALLVGIGEYPNPANRLAGCTNDVFLMSRVLQEAGFEARNIRVLLNDRATAQAIVERLEWLLEGAGDGQHRVFYYAGHGAQIPGYGVGETVDRLDECLVPYDFDWTRERAVVDDQFYELYSQLPEDTEFLSIFDCCHSGGMAREGGLIARGLTPPDDIRHRLLAWDPDTGTFAERSLRGGVEVRRQRKDYRYGPVRRLGCAVGLRLGARPEYNAARREFGHRGPFMPFILQACNEGELAYEYRHGSTSNGAFTWFLAQVLHDPRWRRKPTWENLCREVAARLEQSDYRQTPQLVCPSSLRHELIPWRKPTNPRRSGRSKV